MISHLKKLEKETLERQVCGIHKKLKFVREIQKENTGKIGVWDIKKMKIKRGNMDEM